MTNIAVLLVAFTCLCLLYLIHALKKRVEQLELEIAMIVSAIITGLKQNDIDIADSIKVIWDKAEKKEGKA